jgi:hypothetical protein
MDIKQSTAVINFAFLLVLSSDHITGATGLTPTVTISKNGGAFAAPSGAVTEIGNGWYKLAANATDSNTLGPLVLHASGTGTDPTDMILGAVVAFDPQDAVRQGLTALPNAAAAATGGLPTVDATNSVKVQAGFKKNTLLSNFVFEMTDSTTHNPTAGLTVTPTRSIDGAAYAAGTLGAVTDLGNGSYSISLPAADMNGNVIALRFTATGADQLDITIVTVA